MPSAEQYLKPEVIRRVAHPGGSTERGLRVLDESIGELSERVRRALTGS